MNMNMNAHRRQFTEKASRQFHLIGQTARLDILLALGKGEACVCHLEAWTGYRQAAISQQLMLLRDAGLVTSHRIGKHIFYALTDPGLLEVIHRMALLNGTSQADLDCLQAVAPLPGCDCPLCAPDHDGKGEPGLLPTQPAILLDPAIPVNHESAH